MNTNCNFDCERYYVVVAKGAVDYTISKLEKSGAWDIKVIDGHMSEVEFSTSSISWARTIGRRICEDVYRRRF